jgi:hypothetical protein
VTALQPAARLKVDADRIGRTQLTAPSAGFGATSLLISRRLEDLQRPSPTFLAAGKPVAAASIEEQLYDALAAFKIRTATVAMHIDRDWRAKLFKQFDTLLDLESWDRDDLTPRLASFSTFLRLLTLLRPSKRPGLGATHDGNLIATWSTGSDRLTMECLAGDIVRWNLSACIDDEVERAAAITPLHRLAEVLKPYHPARWFDDAHNLPTG